jgi:acyl-CoA synthetase (NDP forming)/GNAT superfamily N-acetyltransferase
MVTQDETTAYALLADGTTFEIRAARPGDFDAVRDMHIKMSADNFYLRFFSMSRKAAEQEARRVCREPSPGHAALLAVLDGEVVGCGSYERAGAGSTSAEVALAVADDMQNRGAGTLLLEHLISLARGRGFRAFVAETMAENGLMLQVLANAGLPTHRSLADGVYQFTFPLPADESDAALDTYRDAVAERERSADVASLRYVLNPASVAVIGASRRPQSVGRAILQNIIDGGFRGPVYAVNPSVAELDGVPCVPSATALPEPVDLAIIATPAATVPGVAEDCGRRGIKALVVTTAGLEAHARAELLGICRRHAMRLVGPAGFGLANTAISLDATFAARHPRQGTAGLALESGGVSIVLLEHLSRLGVGISSFVSLGDKDDVSGNDMLLWWESDAVTKLAVLYLASFGNPRKFARTARAVGRTMPILTVNVGRSAAGQHLATARQLAVGRLATARGRVVASPQLTRQALFEQAGVIATANLGELIDTAALLASQPVPRGSRVAVVSNARGAGVLAADACDDAGLEVASMTEDTQRALRDILPADATVAGPVDTTAVVAPGVFRRCLELVGADPGVDAVLTLTATTATIDLVPEVQAARLPVPVAAAVMDQAEVVRLLPSPGEDSPAVPAYAYPESAARALGHAARYGWWLATPQGQVADLEGLRQAQARELADGFLVDMPKGGWLSQEQAVPLLGCYSVPIADHITVTAEDAAAEAAGRFGGPVALKADLRGVVRPVDAGAVIVDLRNADEVRRGFRSLRETFGGRLAAVIVQPMITGGVEVRISVLQEQVFGPLVLFGVGAAAEVLADRAARLAPLTGSDADVLIHSTHATPLLLGRPGAPAADIAALRDTLLRVSVMADDLPQMAELDLRAVARPDGVWAVDTQVRIQAAEPTDPYLRRLR